jgi:anion-transporting  ArsA/GET3 family ATPase
VTEERSGSIDAAGDTLMRKLLGQRLIICLGSGGVGKTTVSAALGLAAARMGRRTAVITVDPARRLKDALGLEELSIDPHPVRLDGVETGLDALALDTKRVFDALIERVSPNPAVAERIRANRLYQELSNELGGSTEYMAMEKLYELLHQERYDLLVVDTPPSAHARDLLSAPLRMSELVASSAVRILKTPASLFWGDEGSFSRMTLTALMKVLERWTGLHLLQELSDFAANFEQLAEGFRARAQDVDQALRREGTSFVLVTTPEPNTVAACVDFHRELRELGFPLAGIVANRVFDFPDATKNAAARYPAEMRRKLLENYRDFTALSRRDRHALSRLESETGSPLLAILAALEEPPSSVEGLDLFTRSLRGAGSWREET